MSPPSTDPIREAGWASWTARLGLAAVLTALLCLWLFPYERLGPFLVAQLEEQTGAEVQVGALEGGLGLGGPMLEMRDLRLRWPDGELEIARAAVRPAWDLSWLQGRPAVFLDLEAPAGRVQGTLRPLEPVSFQGRGREIDTQSFPERWLGEGGSPLEGLLDAEFDVERSRNGRVHGSVRFESRDGIVAVPDWGLALPYARLEGDVSRAPDGETAFRRVHLESPLGIVEGSGTLGATPDWERAALALELDLRAAGPGLGLLLQPLGVSLDGSGTARLQISGTPSRPVIRAR